MAYRKVFAKQKQWMAEVRGAPTKERMVAEMTMSWKNPCAAHSMKQPIMIQRIDESVDHEAANQQINESANQWFNDWVSQWINEWVNQWVNGMNHWIKEGMNQWICQPHPQKVLQSLIFVRRFWNPNRPLATVWCTFCRSHLPKVLRSPQFLRFWSAKQTHWNANRALATVWCTFCRSHLPKVLRRR